MFKFLKSLLGEEERIVIGNFYSHKYWATTEDYNNNETFGPFTSITEANKFIDKENKNRLGDRRLFRYP